MALLESLLIHLGVDADDLDREARRIEDGLNRVGTNAAALGRSLGSALSIGPALAPAVTAVGGFAAAFASAGAGVAAFTAAVKPQFAGVTEAADLYTAAQEAQAEGGKKAAEAQRAYRDALNELPPATRATAEAFIGLRSDFQSWSDSLSSTTMPIFTNGINTLRTLLPSLTPFVKDAASAIGDFGAQVGKDLKSEGFKEFMTDMQNTAKQVLPDLLSSIRNIAIGFGGILQAFMPMSATMTGGLENLTAKFADWGSGLKDSEAFGAFRELSSAGGGALANLGTALVEVLVSLEPVLGATTQLATVFAQVVAAIPTDVLVTLGQVLLALKAATIAYTVVTRTIAIATGLWSAAQGALNIVMMLNPIGLIIAAIVALVAIIVMVSTRTTFFKDLWNTVWNSVKTITQTVWNWIKNAISTAIDFLVMLFMNFTGPGLIIQHWDTIKSATSAAWNWVKNAVKNVFNFLKNLFLNFTGPGLIIKHWNKIKDATNSAWNWVKNLISNVLSSIKDFISSRLSAAKNAAVNAFNTIKNTIRDRINSARSAVSNAVGGIVDKIRGIKDRVMGAVRGALNWLKEAGKNVIRGFIDGIRSMGGAVRDAISDIAGSVTDFLPFSPAKEGPMSGQGAPEISGQRIGENLARGIRSGISEIESASGMLLGPLDSQQAAIRQALARRTGQVGRAGVAAGMGGANRIVIDVTGADEGMKELIRRLMRTSQLVVQ